MAERKSHILNAIRSLRFRVYGLLVAMAIGMMGYVLLIWQPNAQQAVLDNIKGNAHAHVFTVGEAILPLVIKYEYASVYEILDLHLEREPTWLTIKLYDGKGEVIYPLFEEAIEASDDDYVFYVEEQITLEGVETITLVAEIDASAHLANQSWENRNLMVVLVATMFGLMMVIAVFLEYAVLVPINALKKATEDVATGNYKEIEIPGISSFELEEMTSSFRDMSNKVKENETRLRDATLQAEEANKAKSAFLATMSHEIRTPINGVLGVAELMRETRLDDEQKNFVRLISSSADFLLSLVNDVLDYSKIEAGEFNLSIHPFDLKDCLLSVHMMLSTQASKKGIQLDRKLDDLGDVYPVLGDRAKFSQVLTNLISNAIKFTEEGSVTCEVLIKREDVSSVDLEVEITDTGVGMDGKQLARIFDQFYQVEEQHQKTQKGTGLGLAISRYIIGQMGGGIQVSSTPGVGSNFTIAVTFEKAAEGSVDVPRDLREEAEKNRLQAKILVVEDNTINQMIALKTLEAQGHEVVLAENGVEALDILDRETFHLVLMDMQMPVMGGAEATCLIRKRNIISLIDGKAMPVIALTANASREAEQECLEAGMDKYITKPIKPKELAGLINSYL